MLHSCSIFRVAEFEKDSMHSLSHLLAMGFRLRLRLRKRTATQPAVAEGPSAVERGVISDAGNIRIGGVWDSGRLGRQRFGPLLIS